LDTYNSYNFYPPADFLVLSIIMYPIHNMSLLHKAPYTSQGKVVPVLLIEHDAMKTYWGVEM